MDMAVLIIYCMFSLTVRLSCMAKFDNREQDLFLACWEMLERILTDESCNDILLDIGSKKAQVVSMLSRLTSESARPAPQCSVQLPSNLLERQDSPDPAQNVSCK